MKNILKLMAVIVVMYSVWLAGAGIVSTFNDIQTTRINQLTDVMNQLDQ